MESSGLIKWFARNNENIENSRCEVNLKNDLRDFLATITVLH